MNIHPENKDFHILVVDDEIEYQRAFSMILSRKGFHVLTCSDGQTALNMLAENEIDLVMTDLKMPGMDGLSLIQKVKELYPSIELMIVTAFGSIESAVQAMKYGATGYFIKSSDPESLLIDINRMVRIKMLEKSNQILLHQQDDDNDLFLDSRTPAFLDVLETCKKAAASSINVLLLGESGVGKEVFANYIHRLSNRKNHHLIPVNCQVFGDGTIESELFGHEKGSFTGAVGRRIGRFEEANHGTIFLDEIGDLPLSVQGKLLRTLESRTIERVGSNRPVDLDLRLICATNNDLQKEITEGRFREDLLYRINALTITIPPLRERKADLPGLIEYFLQRICRDQKKKITSVSSETMDALLQYDYPGNVRELRNILERMVALNDGTILHGNFPYASSHPAKSAVSGSIPENSTDSSSGFACLRDARAQFEKDYIEGVLKHTGGNVTEAAEILQITKRQLWNKISEYEIHRTSL
ncbi:MAG: sigma-54-dependent Fis family transcriptional regulator [Firmicutes bacterium]|nr:sigma-54-dependent Fis family transcriptional regulator [Bacillota bacterium]